MEDYLEIVPVLPLEQQYINRYKGLAGIYCICHKENNIYVGQSKDLRHRLWEHARPDALNKKVEQTIKEEGRANTSKAIALYGYIRDHREEITFCVFETLPVDDDYYKKIDELERQYIEKLKPKFNYLGIDVPYIPQWKGKKYE